MGQIGTWVDRNLWSVPATVFVLAEATLSIWSAASKAPVLLAAASITTRTQVYSSLTGSASALLGLMIAAVAILAAFAPRPDGASQLTKREQQLTRARTIVISALLASSFFLLVLLITATVGLAVDSRQVGNSAITTLIEATAAASALGMLLGGTGLALVVVERSRA